MARTRGKPHTGRRAAPKVTRAEQRLFRETLPASEDDKAWFLARPHRTHRVRLAVAAEAELAQAGGITPETIAACGPRAVIVTVVKQFYPGVRLRKWGVTTDMPPDDEAFAVWVWEKLGGDGELGARMAARIEEVKGTGERP